MLVLDHNMHPPPGSGDLEQPPRAVNLEVTAHVGDTGYRTPSVHQV